MDDPDLKLWEKIATPTRFAATVSREYMGQQYRPYPWLLHVERKVLDAIADPAQRFIILNVPPQSGKTTFSGMFLPAWYLGMYPHHQVLFIGYSQEYAASWGAKARGLIDRYGRRLFGVGLSKSQSAIDNWKMDNGFGGMISVGILGGITGNPGHLVIIDDVIKTMEEAASPTTKRKHLAEYDGAISSRFQEAQEQPDGTVLPGTTVLVTATRFADDDLSGSLIERMDKLGYEGDKWEVISLPALAEPPEDMELDDEEMEKWRDELGRARGEALQGRFTRRHYEQRRASMDPFTFSAVYQQRPTLAEGGMFPAANWQFWNPQNIPSMMRRVRVWDLAATDGGGDWTVGSLFGLGSNGDLYLLDRVRGRWNSADVERKVQSTAKADGTEVKVIIEQEKAGAGKREIEHYKRLLAGYVVEAGKIDGEKEVRARPYSSMQLNRRVWLPEHETVVCKEWIDEHKRMMGDGRRPRHDDQIDTGAYATIDLIGLGVTDLWIPGEDERRDIA